MFVRFVDRFENSYDVDARDGKDGTRTGLQQFHLRHKTLQTFQSETEKECFRKNEMYVEKVYVLEDDIDMSYVVNTLKTRNNN